MESTLSLYKIFYTVANTQNISRASRELYISQPAISKAIQKLEQSLGVTLFYRNSRGVTLTHEGTCALHPCAECFSVHLPGRGGCPPGGHRRQAAPCISASAQRCVNTCCCPI